MRLRICILIISAFYSLILHSRELPKTGKYNVKVKVESLDGQVLSGFCLIYNGDTLYTDTLGYALIQVHWEYRHTTKTKYKRKVNNLLNGKYIFIESSKGDKFFVKNKWRKYMKNDSEDSLYSVTVRSLVYNRVR